MSGKTLANYRLVDQIGMGGYSVVYRAIDTRSGKNVAAKIVSSASETPLNHLNRDSEILRHNIHPLAPGFIDFDLFDGCAYLAMELIEGDLVEDMITGREGVTLYQAAMIGRALAYAFNRYHNYRGRGYRKGIVYKDAKPVNVVITPNGAVRLLDFGLACGVGDSDGSLMVYGTPRYMSPEQVSGERLDERSDIYSTGITIQRIVQGKDVVDGENAREIMCEQRAMHNDIPELKRESVLSRYDLAPARLGDKVDLIYETFRSLLWGMVRKKHKERTQSFTEVIPHLELLCWLAKEMLRYEDPSVIV